MAKDNVVTLDVSTTLPVPPKRVLSAALDADLSSVLVVGFEQSGNLYFAMSQGDAAELLLALRLAERQLLVSEESANGGE